MKGLRIGRAKVIFKLPQAYLDARSEATAEVLVFVEWFTVASQDPNPNSKMYRIKKERYINHPFHVNGEVVKLSSIKNSIQLIPAFPKDEVDQAWTSNNVLDVCNEFYINNWSSIRAYQSIY